MKSRPSLFAIRFAPAQRGGAGGPGRPATRRITIAIIAATKRRCNHPPRVYELIRPSSHKIIRITASVNNIASPFVFRVQAVAKDS